MTETNVIRTETDSGKLVSWIHGFAVVGSIILVMLLVSDLVIILSDGSMYPFEVGEGRWHYSSKLAYGASLVFEILLCITVVTAFFTKAKRNFVAILLILWYGYSGLVLLNNGRLL